MSMSPADQTAVQVSRALGDPTRFALLRTIAGRPDVSCQELTASLPLAQATVSHHLRVLADAGLVAVKKRGPFHLYRALGAAVTGHARHLSKAFVRRST
jgi:ArsR family transcriptional regulator